MRRRLAILAVAALAAGVIAVVLGASGGSHGQRYWVELDNAFGLIDGGDLKVAGVRAGTIKQIQLDQRTHRALVQIEITRAGFGSLRADTRCQTRPQSLIGEYFLDCDPGTSPKALAAGARIPVTHTASTVAPDLINDIMRRPYRERLSIILGELGAGVAGRGPELNAAIRRASPALRETDRVLAMLAQENGTLRDLVANADRVVGALSDNRRDVGRFVLTARDTAQASARRRGALAAGFHRLPKFLEQLKPSMAALGQVARNQTPALRNLDASAQQLQELFTRLQPFAKASSPAFDALSRASKTGSAAVAKAGPVVDQLAAFSGATPELGKNLATILEHLDDRKWAVEPDPRSPGGKGYTGLEALLTYVYDQALSTNAYDSNVHYLKVALDQSECSHYADIAAAKKLEAKCAARLGPHALGFNFDDPTKSDSSPEASPNPSHRVEPNAGGPGQPPLPTGNAPTGDAPAPAGGGTDAPTASSAVPSTGAPGLPPVNVPGLPQIGGGGSSSGSGVALPTLPGGAARLGLSASAPSRSEVALLDYLMGP